MIAQPQQSYSSFVLCTAVAWHMYFPCQRRRHGPAISFYFLNAFVAVTSSHFDCVEPRVKVYSPL